MRDCKPLKNRVYVECSDTDRRVKATIINKAEAELSVQMPTGFVLSMRKKRRRGPFVLRVGQIEFYSDGKEVS